MEKDLAAQRISDLADTALSSKSQIDKFELHQQLISSWRELSCDQKVAVGKELENSSSKNEKDAKAFAFFKMDKGEMTELIFYKQTGVANDFPFGDKRPILEQLKVKQPFKGCEKE